MDKIKQSMIQKLQSAFQVIALELENESHLHHRPKGAETHFKLLVVSDDFAGQSRVDRQRKIQNLFDEERALGLHALSIRALSGREWEMQKADIQFVTPNCQHKNQT